VVSPDPVASSEFTELASDERIATTAAALERTGIRSLRAATGAEARDLVRSSSRTGQRCMTTPPRPSPRSASPTTSSGRVATSRSDCGCTGWTGRCNGIICVFATKAGAPTNPDWYRNAVAAGDGMAERGTEEYEVTVRDLRGPERDHVYAEQARNFPGFAEYERQTAGVRTIPVLELAGSRAAPPARQRSTPHGGARWALNRRSVQPVRSGPAGGLAGSR
jgi:deazaflavin-dependent oxidoreductase (nitroreductase family)